MGRVPCCDKANVKRGPWSPDEDATLRDYLQKHGNGGNWISLPLKAGLRRCGKSCRLRWLNYLRPNIKHGGFTEEEDDIICGLYKSLGSRWSKIALHLPGRTDNDVKNYWNTKLKKKLMAPRVTNGPDKAIRTVYKLINNINDPTREHADSASPISIPDKIDHHHPRQQLYDVHDYRFLMAQPAEMVCYDQYCPLTSPVVEVPASGGFSEQVESSTGTDFFMNNNSLFLGEQDAMGGLDSDQCGSRSSVGGAAPNGVHGDGIASFLDFGFDLEDDKFLYGLGFYDSELDDFNKTPF